MRSKQIYIHWLLKALVAGKNWPLVHKTEEKLERKDQNKGSLVNNRIGAAGKKAAKALSLETQENISFELLHLDNNNHLTTDAISKIPTTIQ